jgi:hypothetical protein
MSPPLFQPLEDGEFRLLDLLPSLSFSEPLKGSLRTVVASSNPEYEALSYVWYDDDVPPPTVEPCIQIGDFDCPITPNLDAALRQCRDSNLSRTLWIDDVCINQGSKPERHVQIRGMDVIFSKASSVIVWLGPIQSLDKTTAAQKLKEITAAMSIFQWFTRRPMFSGWPPWKYITSFTAHGKPFLEPVTSSTHELIRAGFQDIFRRQWFQRIWVVQEAVLAQHVIMKCGSAEACWTPDDPEYLRIVARRIKLSELSPAWDAAGLSASSMEPILELIQLQMERLLEMQLETHGEGHAPYALSFRRDFLDIVHQHRRRQTTFPQDSINALAALGTLDGERFRVDGALDRADTYELLRVRTKRMERRFWLRKYRLVVKPWDSYFRRCLAETLFLYLPSRALRLFTRTAALLRYITLFVRGRLTTS